jgi:hypothetical protein
VYWAGEMEVVVEAGGMMEGAWVMVGPERVVVWDVEGEGWAVVVVERVVGV